MFRSLMMPDYAGQGISVVALLNVIEYKIHGKSASGTNMDILLDDTCKLIFCANESPVRG